MGRAYAGILGPLAMAVVICRGWLGSGGIESTLTSAITFLAVFSIVGALIGQLAQSIVDDSVQSKLQLELSRTENAAA
jgi:hypothetical protein